MGNVYIVNGARTAFTNLGSSFVNTTDIELGIQVTKEAIKRSKISNEQIDNIVFGNVIHTNKSSSFLARHIGLRAGLRVESTALTVNRLCGSGMQAIISAAQAINDCDSSVAIAGGTENMSQSPHVLRGTRFGSLSKAPQIDDMLWESLNDSYIGVGMGLTAENLAEKYGISRSEQDEFALRSHNLAENAHKNDRWVREIVPIEINTKKGAEIISRDEHIRQNLKIENLSKLKPAFKAEGSVTAGNASGINDGASAVILASEEWLSENTSIKPLAKIISWAVAGVDPNIMGIGPVPAIKRALKKANLSIDDIDLIELNEAFAAQSLAIIKELDLDINRVNVNGGAIALGHPVGASGTRIVYSLSHELHERNVKYGLASLCIGGGQGIAMIIEKV